LHGYDAANTPSGEECAFSGSSAHQKNKPKANGTTKRGNPAGTYDFILCWSFVPLSGLGDFWSERSPSLATLQWSREIKIL
jgi:hypothetical protein